MAGKNTQKLTIADFFAFIMLIVASVVYNWVDEVKLPTDKILMYKEFDSEELDNTFLENDNVVEINLDPE